MFVQLPLPKIPVGPHTVRHTCCASSVSACQTMDQNLSFLYEWTSQQNFRTTWPTQDSNLTSHRAQENEKRLIRADNLAFLFGFWRKSSHLPHTHGCIFTRLHIQTHTKLKKNSPFRWPKKMYLRRKFYPTLKQFVLSAHNYWSFFHPWSDNTMSNPDELSEVNCRPTLFQSVHKNNLVAMKKNNLGILFNYR